MSSRDPECDGICLTGSDVGIPSNEIAYPHPDCPAHGDPDRESEGTTEITIHPCMPSLGEPCRQPCHRCAVTDHAFVPAPNADECLYSPTGSWETTCYQTRQQHNPEPIECPKCEGTGRITGDRFIGVTCGRCLGDGVVERDE